MFKFVFHLGRNVIRLYNQSPLWLRIKAKVNDTKIGKLNLKTHLIWEKFRNDYADKFIFYSFTKLNLWYFNTSLIYVRIFLCENF